MPNIIRVGKRKSGEKREYVYPSKLFGSRGNIVWKEWEVKNTYRDKIGPKIFDSNGRIINGENNSLLVDQYGKMINGKIKTNFSKREVLKLLVRERKKQKELKWQSKKLRDAFEVLFKIETMHNGQEERALKMILKNPLFREAIMLKKLPFPDVKNISVKEIQSICSDFFLDVYLKQSREKKSMFKDGAKKVLGGIKQIIKP